MFRVDNVSLEQHSQKLMVQDKETIIKKLKDRNIPVSVNYTRRFVKEYSNIKKKLSEEKIFSCVCYYDRGLLRDGSHAIDMFNYFFGKIQNGFFTGEIRTDHFEKTRREKTEGYAFYGYRKITKYG